MSTMYIVESRNEFKNSHLVLFLVFLQLITLWGKNVYSLLNDTKSEEQKFKKKKLKKECHKCFDSCARYEAKKNQKKKNQQKQ